jgi:hypothetical protein
VLVLASRCFVAGHPAVFQAGQPRLPGSSRLKTAPTVQIQLPVQIDKVSYLDQTVWIRLWTISITQVKNADPPKLERYSRKRSKDTFFIACLKAGLTLTVIIPLSAVDPNEILGEIVSKGNQ